MCARHITAHYENSQSLRQSLAWIMMTKSEAKNQQQETQKELKFQQ